MLRIISLFKKLFSKAKKGKKPEGKEKAEFPPGTKIGLFGHTNVGKTVFFTMLFEATRYDPKFKLDTRDDQTAAELLRNLRDMMGQDITVHDGRRMDKRVARKFPPPTSETKYLSFVAVLNKRTRLPFTSVDYRGEIASIHEQPELKEELVKFLSQSDCLLFFMEPNAIHSEVDCREQMASFNDILQRLSDGGNKGLNVAVGLVITKADQLVGFEDESQTNLIGRTCEYSKTKGYQKFVDQLLGQSQIKKRGRWREELKTIMNRLRTFFETLSAMNLDFQVFFVSGLGNPPLHEIGDKGEMVMTPPRELKPIGIKEPFRWAIKRILIKKRLNTLRKITKWVLALTLIWALFYSIPNLLNLAFWYPKIGEVEKRIEQGGYQNNLAGLGKENLTNFKKTYRYYARRRWVSSFFGMGGLKDFARQRENDFKQALTSVPSIVEEKIVEEKPKVEKLSPEDSAVVAVVDSVKQRYQDLKDLIMARRESPEFLLVGAVDSLQAFLQSIKGLSKDARLRLKYIKKKVDRYFNQARCWDDEKEFNLTIEEGIPDRYALLISSGGKKIWRFFSQDHKPRAIPWKREKDYNVTWILENAKTGDSLDAVNFGSFEILILESPVKFHRAGCELKIKIDGFECELPKPEDL